MNPKDHGSILKIAVQSTKSWFFLFYLFLLYMDQLLQQIEEYKKEIGQFSANDAKAIEEFRIRWLGTKGIIKNLMGGMKNVPNERKKEFGQVMNNFKSLVENKYESLKHATNDSEL